MSKDDKNGFNWFAYPYGVYNDIVVKEVKKYYDGALSCIQGNNINRYELNRITVFEDNSFKKKDEFVIAKLKKKNVISKIILAEKVKNSIFKKFWIL